MKTLSKLFLASLILFTIVSCKKSDDGGDGGSAAEGTLTAKVNGSVFTSPKITTSAQYVQVGKSLTILGSDATGKAINIIISNYDGSTGTWQIPNGVGLIGVIGSYTEVNIGSLSTKTWVAPYSNSGVIGEVKISEFSKTGNVKGTFKFKARNQDNVSDIKDITDGSFSVKVTSF